MLSRRMRSGNGLWCALVLVSIDGLFGLVGAQEHGPQCRTDGPLVQLPEVPEASGIAVSRNPRRIWVNNDSGQPVLFAVNERGQVTARVRLTGMTVDDWEATAIGPCAGGSCLFLADIGDNAARRKRIVVYRIPEPKGSTEEVAVRDSFQATYPDGPHDAEALLITPKGDMLIVTKGDTGPVAIYRFPPDARPNSTVTLVPVGKPRHPRKPDSTDRITDGAVSPNGEWAVLRTNRTLYFYRTADLMAGEWRAAGRVDVSRLGEPQGEGVTFADDTTLYLAGEGGGKSRPGTLARMTCTF